MHAEKKGIPQQKYYATICANMRTTTIQSVRENCLARRRQSPAGRNHPPSAARPGLIDSPLPRKTSSKSLVVRTGLVNCSKPGAHAFSRCAYLVITLQRHRVSRSPAGLGCLWHSEISSNTQEKWSVGHRLQIVLILAVIGRIM